MPHSSSNTDEDLFRNVREGNMDAFTELYLRYWKLLFYIAAKRLGYTEAEESVQNIFTDFWERRETIEIHTSVKYYLAAAVHYQVMKVLAKKKIAAAYNVPDSMSDERADNYLNFHELQRQLEGLVTSLPEKCRIVYQLSREQGLKNKAIAQHLGISEKTVENQLTKALLRIRKGLQNESFVLLVLFEVLD